MKLPFYTHYAWNITHEVDAFLFFLLSENNNINKNISLAQFDLDVKLGDNYATGNEALHDFSSNWNRIFC